MEEILLIGLGGFLGAIARYGVGRLFPKTETGFFYGTFLVNVLGSFLLSMWLFLDEWSTLVPSHLRGFVALGFLGAFTTMSTFSFELLKLMNAANWGMFALYLSLTLTGVLLGSIAGKEIASHLMK